MNLRSDIGSNNYGLPESEDCLTLNVVRPTGIEGPLPVDVWIYGGQFIGGASSRNTYNLSYIVEESVKMGKPMIGVSINYRLSGFGWLAGSEVGKTGNTNVGLRDQLLAFGWIHENIEAFGGDPDHFVIWGQCAGSMSVAFQLCSNRLGDYVKGAIMESGFATTANLASFINSDFNNGAYKNVTDYLGCSNTTNSFENLQSINASKLLQTFNWTNGIIKTQAFASIAIDNDYIQDFAGSLFENGNFTKIPVISGKDLRDYISSSYDLLNETSVDRILSIYSENNPDYEIPYQPAFPLTFDNATFGSAHRRSASIAGDIMFAAPRWFLMQIWAKNNIPAYSYRWNLYDYGTLPQFGATHAAEVIYVFDNNQANFNNNTGQPRQRNETLVSIFNPDGTYTNHDVSRAKMADIISKQWISFITTLNPNNHDIYGIPEWPIYDLETPTNYVYDWRSIYKEADDFRKEGMEFIMDVAEQLLM